MNLCCIFLSLVVMETAGAFNCFCSFLPIVLSYVLLVNTLMKRINLCKKYDPSRPLSSQLVVVLIPDRCAVRCQLIKL